MYGTHSSEIIDIEWESLVSQGMEAREQKDNSQWKLGELADSIETVYGMDALGKFATEVGIVKNTLRRYRDVHRAYSKHNRIPQLSFSHHLIALAGENPSWWLTKALENNWSCEQLRMEIQSPIKIKRGAIPEWCQKCEGWKTRKLCNCSLH